MKCFGGLKEVLQDDFPVRCHDGFGMKLDAVHGIKAVLHGHDLPVIGDGGDFEIRRERSCLGGK